MAEFCGDCRFKGACEGDISEDNIAQVTMFSRPGKFQQLLGRHGLKTLNWGTYTVATNEQGQTSEIIPTSGQSAEEVIAAIGSCAMPRRRGICGAFPNSATPYEATPTVTLMKPDQVIEKLALTSTEG